MDKVKAAHGLALVLVSRLQDRSVANILDDITFAIETVELTTGALFTEQERTWTEEMVAESINVPL